MPPSAIAPQTATASSRHADLWWARVLTLGPVVLALPLATAAVFIADAGRGITADVVAMVYSLGLFAAFSTSLWPLPSLRGWSCDRRIRSLCIFFLGVSYATHLSWELLWVLFHHRIAAAQGAAWAYPWWAYIDGGDMRYAHAPASLVIMESLSVLNGVVGGVGFWLWYRSRQRDMRAILLFMATAVVHLYSTSLYYGSEVLAGFPNVDTNSIIASWFKFGLANAPWLVCPWLVLYWGYRTLQQRVPQP